MSGRVGWAGWVGWGGSSGWANIVFCQGTRAYTRSTAGSSEVSVLLDVNRWFDVRAYRLTMGDFPRCIDRQDVDSAAVYAAYTTYELSMEEKHSHITGAYRPVWDSHLLMIDHRKPVGVCLPRDVVKNRVRQMHSRQQSCRRCNKRRAIEAARMGSHCPDYGLLQRCLQ